MKGKIQANLKPKTVERISKIADKPVTRGLDKMINECFDKMEKNCGKSSNEGENQKDE